MENITFIYDLLNSTLDDGPSKTPATLTAPLLKNVHDILIVVLLICVMFAMGCSITLQQVSRNFLLYHKNIKFLFLENFLLTNFFMAKLFLVNFLLITFFSFNLFSVNFLLIQLSSHSALFSFKFLFSQIFFDQLFYGQIFIGRSITFILLNNRFYLFNNLCSIHFT